MKIEFDDGSFLQLNDTNNHLEFVQCAKKDRTLIMSATKLTKEQAQEVLAFITNWIERGN
jgi:hypothetical protein